MQRTDLSPDHGGKPITGSVAYLTEIFDSFQGEGVWAGVRQLFIRLGGCHLRCAYCDTPDSLIRQNSFRIISPEDSTSVEIISNPVSAEELTRVILNLGSGDDYHSLAVTGGEPLLQSDFLNLWLPDIRGIGWKIYLETSGDLYDRFASVSHLMDYGAIDIKLPSSTHQQPRWEEHQRFLEIARNSAVQFCVKTIVSGATTLEEIRMVAEMIAVFSADITLILQPVTPYGAIREPISPRHLRTLQRCALDHLRDVRIIPQMHKFLGAL